MPRTCWIPRIVLDTRFRCFTFVHFCTWLRGRGVRGAVLLWRSDDNLTELIISFYHMGPGDLTPVIGRDGRNFYLLSPLTSPTPFMSLLCSTLAFIPNLRNKTCKNRHRWAETTRTIKAKLQLISLYLQYAFIRVNAVARAWNRFSYFSIPG